MFEEIRLEGEGVMPTPHDQIRVFCGGQPSFEQVRRWLEELSTLVESQNVHGLISKLVSIVPEYEPSKEISVLCEVDRHDQVLVYNRARTAWTAIRTSRRWQNIRAEYTGVNEVTVPKFAGSFEHVRHGIS